MIKADLGQVDQVVYSLAAPQAPKTGEIISSTLKPIGEPITLRGLDTDKEVITETTLQPATPEEIAGTVAVMGGEDWQMWIDALADAGVLANGCTTTAFTYVGEEITQAIYWNGSIGAAKKDLDTKVLGLREKLAKIGGDACVGAEGRGDPGQLGHSDHAAVPVAAVQGDEGKGTHEAASSSSTCCTTSFTAAGPMARRSTACATIWSMAMATPLRGRRGRAPACRLQGNGGGRAGARWSRCGRR